MKKANVILMFDIHVVCVNKNVYFTEVKITCHESIIKFASQKTFINYNKNTIKYKKTHKLFNLIIGR